MFRSRSSDPPSEKSRDAVDPNKATPKKVKGIRRRKSVTRIESDEIVDQIELYIHHLERTIDDQKIFINSLLEENRRLKVKRKLKEKILDSRPTTSKECLAECCIARNPSFRVNPLDKPDTILHLTKSEPPKPSVEKKPLFRNHKPLIERLLDTSNRKTPTDVLARARHSSLSEGPGNRKTKTPTNPSYTTMPVARGSPYEGKERSYKNFVKELRKIREAKLLQRWIDEAAADDDDLWSDS